MRVLIVALSLIFACRNGGSQADASPPMPIDASVADASTIDATSVDGCLGSPDGTHQEAQVLPADASFTYRAHFDAAGSSSALCTPAACLEGCLGANALHQDLCAFWPTASVPPARLLAGNAQALAWHEGSVVALWQHTASDQELALVVFDAAGAPQLGTGPMDLAIRQPGHGLDGVHALIPVATDEFAIFYQDQLGLTNRFARVRLVPE